jgi:hypothetical protein
MRLAIGLLAILALLVTGQLNIARAGLSANVSAATIQSEPAPKIINVRRDGKRLIVSGESFQMGAKIVVNGEPQKTRNDEDNPNALLIAKKAGKHLPANAVITIQVENPVASKSDPFAFFTGITLTLADAGKPIHLKVKEQFLLSAKADVLYNATLTVQDESIVKKIADVGPPADGQAIYEAQRVGQTNLFAALNPKCADQIRECKIPSLLYTFNLNIDQ